jgi:hypothetical protein
VAYKDKNDPRYKASRKRWYLNNKAKHLANAKKRKDQKREYIRLAKDKPCMDCEQSFPYYVMDFDHRDGETKFRGLALMITESLVRIKAEIEKCDLICSNCHRIRTFKRMVNNRDLLN